MVAYPGRPEGTVAEQIEQLWTLIWRLCEEINLLEEAAGIRQEAVGNRQ